MTRRSRSFVVCVVLTLAGATAASSLGSTVGSSVRGRVDILGDGETERGVDVLVYLDAAGAEREIPVEMREADFSITSRNKAFEPRTVAVPVGVTISFPNVDDIMHNVFSLSRGNRFDLGLYKSGAEKDLVFENPGLVRVYCNIHPQMSAFVHVLDHPFFAWSGADGSFEIAGVPAGRYVLKVWHEQGEAETSVQVTENGANDVVVQLDVSGFKRRPHLNKFGKPYKRKRGKY